MLDMKLKCGFLAFLLCARLFSNLIDDHDLYFPELHEKWEARRAEERARQEAERAERERKEKEEAERKAAEEAKRKEEEERLRQEQAEETGEGEEETQKVDEEDSKEEKAGEEEGKEEEEEDDGPTAEPKATETPEVQPSVEDLSLGPGPEEEELILDSDMPPNTPETEEFKNLRTNYDRDFTQLLSVLKGTNNIEPIMVAVDKELDKLSKEVVKRVEGKKVHLCDHCNEKYRCR